MENLKIFELNTSNTIDESITAQFFDQLQNIENISLNGKFSYFNLDNFAHLRALNLEGTINENFTFRLSRVLSERLEELSFSFENIDESTLFELFDNYDFPKLQVLVFSQIDSLENLNMNFFKRFPNLRELTICGCCKLKIIEDYTFSNLEHLVNLDLSNNSLEKLNKRSFCNLKNIETLYLDDNKLSSLDKELFIDLPKSAKISILNNALPIVQNP
jgi:Leucine-rich repeat (LRR) protein